MAPDRRKLDRSAIWVEADCHSRGEVRHARLTDVSNCGCRAEVAIDGMAPGDRVLLKLSELLVLPAMVIWVDGKQSGLRFGNPMLGAMLGQFALRFGKRGRLH